MSQVEHAECPNKVTETCRRWNTAQSPIPLNARDTQCVPPGTCLSHLRGWVALRIGDSGNHGRVRALETIAQTTALGGNQPFLISQCFSRKLRISRNPLSAGRRVAAAP